MELLEFQNAKSGYRRPMNGLETGCRSIATQHSDLTKGNCSGGRDGHTVERTKRQTYRFTQKQKPPTVLAATAKRTAGAWK